MITLMCISVTALIMIARAVLPCRLPRSRHTDVFSTDYTGSARELSRFVSNIGKPHLGRPNVSFVISRRSWLLVLYTTRRPPKCHVMSAFWCRTIRLGPMSTLIGLALVVLLRASSSCSIGHPSHGGPNVSLAWLCPQPKQSLSLPLP